MTEKQKHSLNVVGLSWFLRWTFIVTITSGIVAASTQWAIQRDLSQATVNVIQVLGGLLILGVQAYELPQPLIPERARWIAYGMIARFLVVALINVILVSVLQTVLLAGESFSFRTFSIIFSLLASLVGGFLHGVAGWLILRDYVRQAHWWIDAIVVGALSGLIMEGAVALVVPVLGIEAANWLSIVLSIIPAFVTAALSGAALWWLIAQQLKDDSELPEKAKRA